MKLRKMIQIIGYSMMILFLICGGWLLILGGVNFFGPWKDLAILKIRKKYPSTSNQKGIIFYGASNFARWKEMEKDLAPYPVQNHGFGGSCDEDLMFYADRLLFPYDPRIVFFQTGSNDYVKIEGSDDEKIQKCMENKRQMFAEFHGRLPDAHFVIMSGLLLPGRAEYLALTQRINANLKELCQKTDYMTFVDAEEMTYSSGSFRTDLFVKDQIHLNREGQLLWARDYILPVLEKTEG
ncbi:MAG: hypothetical protein J5589_11820 [Firmicutes bacterium]|nr:hypothetical protein [Bacillota bacterium]